MPDPAEIRVQAASRLIAGVFGFVFAGIGFSVLGFLWLSGDGFHSPPVFFKIFGSLIALPFVAIGGTLLVGAISGKRLIGHASQLNQVASRDGPSPGTSATYRCPRCGAPLGKQAEVSPAGDVKCTFCNTWFNIHQAGS